MLFKHVSNIRELLQPDAIPCVDAGNDSARIAHPRQTIWHIVNGLLNQQLLITACIRTGESDMHEP